MHKSSIPFQSDVTQVTAHRKPTAAEIKFGNGATHYKTFPVELWKDKNDLPKCWIVCPDDYLRYYR
jgi:hypothetical protein